MCLFAGIIVDVTCMHYNDINEYCKKKDINSVTLMDCDMLKGKEVRQRKPLLMSRL